MRQIELAQAAIADIDAILDWSVEQFGNDGMHRYRLLIGAALTKLSQDPKPVGSKSAEDILPGLFRYHIRHSRMAIEPAMKRVKRPRHFIIYRFNDECIEVVRLLHDSMDLERHLRD